MTAWIKTIKNSATFATIAKSVTGFLKKEDGFYLLLETGGKIIIEPMTGADWNTTQKSS